MKILTNVRIAVYYFQSVKQLNNVELQTAGIDDIFLLDYLYCRSAKFNNFLPIICIIYITFKNLIEYNSLMAF